mgnify:CR=1
MSNFTPNEKEARAKLIMTIFYSLLAPFIISGALSLGSAIYLQEIRTPLLPNVEWNSLIGGLSVLTAIQFIALTTLFIIGVTMNSNQDIE